MDTIKNIDWGHYNDLLTEHLKHDPHPFNNINLLYIIIFLIGSLIIVNVPNIWKYTGIGITVIHETGHALAALTVFGRLRGIHINTDHSGDTNYISSNFFLFRIWSSFWGYPFPSVGGALLILAVCNGWGGLALTICCVISLIIALQIRNFLALLSIGLLTVGVIFAWVNFPPLIINLLLLFFGMFFVIGGIRSCFELASLQLRGEAPDSDAVALRNSSLIPAMVWVVAFIALSVTSGLYAFYTLFQHFL